MATQLADPYARSDESAGHFHRAGLWVEVISQQMRASEIESEDPLPTSLIDTYADAAVRRATWEQIDAGEWLATIAEAEGVWATGLSPSDVESELHDVVVDWVVLKMIDGDLDIPVFGGVDLRRSR